MTASRHGRDPAIRNYPAGPGECRVPDGAGVARAEGVAVGGLAAGVASGAGCGVLDSRGAGDGDRDAAGVAARVGVIRAVRAGTAGDAGPADGVGAGAWVETLTGVGLSLA